jgi:hypothetical protein
MAQEMFNWQPKVLRSQQKYRNPRTVHNIYEAEFATCPKFIPKHHIGTNKYIDMKWHQYSFQ